MYKNESPAQLDDAVSEVKKRKPKRKIGKIIGRIIITLLILTVIAGAAWRFYQRNRQAPAEITTSYSEHTVGTHDITLNLSGTGSLNPADSYSVTTLISGEILHAPFEEGDIVEKDMQLYKVDSSNVTTSIEQAENALAQTRRTYEQRLKALDDLIVKATESGTVIELNVEEGDKISAGATIARIRNSAVMSLTVPFGADDVNAISVGQSAVVTLDSSFEQLAGIVTKISPLEERLEGNVLVRMVTIDVANPGGISLDMAATAAVGDIYCGGSGTFSYKAESVVTASVSGEVTELTVEEGGYIEKNAVLMVLDSESMRNDVLNSESSLRDSELSLQNRYDQLDSYTIKSPISGTIIEKNYKEGDTMESGKILCTIFDLSYLTMTLNIDELDISRVQEGQSVTITAEALPGREYEGIVTKVNINGTTQSGVTSYPVTIRIEETEGLLPGMNVQASIVVSQSKETVAIPVSALSRGNRVLVKGGGGMSDGSGAPGGGMSDGSGAPGGGMSDGSGAPGGGMPDGSGAPGGGMSDGSGAPGGGMSDGSGAPGGGMSDGSGAPGGADTSSRSGGFGSRFGASFGGGNTSADSLIPEGFSYVVVEPGISDGTYIEILSGLSPGDIIAVPELVIPDAQQFFGMMPAGGGGARPAGGGGNVTVTRVGG